MTLRVAGKNFDIGEALRHHIVDRINQMGSKYLNASMTGLIVIDHEGNGYKSDCTLHMKTGTSLHSDGISHDPYVSFDQAADRLEKRLRRHKQRLQSHQSAHHAAPQPIAGKKTLLQFQIQPGDGLEQYLGAWGHVLGASDDLIDMIHQHPLFANDSGQIQFNMIFPRARNYRVWVQFQRNGVVNTAHFDVPVRELE